MIVRNATYNVIGLIVNVIAGFIVSPILVKSFGNTLYGIWVLLISLTSQFGLFDFGIQSAVLQFTARYLAEANFERMNRLINTSLMIFSIAGFLTLAATAIISMYFGGIFHVPSQFEHDSIIALWIVGLGIAVSFPLTVFNGVLAGMQRYDLINIVGIISVVARSAATVILLHYECGLIAIALTHVIATIGGRLFIVFLALRECPETRLSIGYLRRDSAKEIFGYASSSFIINVSSMLFLYVDSLVIGIGLSPEDVTVFSIACSIVIYLRQLASSITWVLNPAVAALHSQHDAIGIKRILTIGTRNSLIVSIPLLILFLIRGPEFIGLWMGNEYRDTAGFVLQILLIGQFFAIPQFVSDSILFGIAKHRYNAVLHFYEGISNIILSVLLLKYFGVYGVAIGATVPIFIFRGILLPHYMLKVVGMGATEYLRDAYFPIIVSLLIFSVVMLCSALYMPAASMKAYFINVSILFIGYIVLIWFKGMDEESRSFVSSSITRFLSLC